MRFRACVVGTVEHHEFSSHPSPPPFPRPRMYERAGWPEILISPESLCVRAFHNTYSWFCWNVLPQIYISKFYIKSEKFDYLAAKSLCTRFFDSRYFIPEAIWIVINSKQLYLEKVRRMNVTNIFIFLIWIYFL